jgi:drug/metabolite transporter (DMT)-like permease
MWLVLSGGAGTLSSLHTAQLGYAALAAFAGPFAARLCLILSARHVDARITTLGALSAPVISVPLEWWVLGHVPPSHELVGGAILLAGIAVPLVRLPTRARDA